MRIPFTIEDIKNSKVAAINPHLFKTASEPNKDKKKSKYGNKKVVVDEVVFDSIKESKRYGELKLLMKAGEIGLLELQKEFKLSVNNKPVASYVADFVYIITSTGLTVVEDVKSAMTRKLPVYRLKKKLMKSCYGIIIKEV